jgi:hypothetical protein
MEVCMGIWKTQAPLSKNGNWAHGAILHLKYNNHARNNATVSKQVERQAADAYAFATRMVEDAVSCADGAMKGVFNSYAGGLKTTEDLFDEYFGLRSAGFQGPQGYSVVHTTLTETLRGLRDNSEQNTLYLFDSTSKAHDPKVSKDTYGYVSISTPGSPNFLAQWGKKRPLVNSHANKDPRAFQKTLALQGHIHLRIDGGGDVIKWATSIIHEATHRFSGTGDFAYLHETDKWAKLTWSEHLNNADSYAHFCRKLYEACATWVTA